MLEYLATICEGVTEISPEEAIGALMLGFFVALAFSKLCVTLQKRATNPLPIICGLILLVSAGSMAVGFGHYRYRLRGGAKHVGPSQARESGRPIRTHRGQPLSPPLGSQLLQEADLDRDGQLTPEEAAEFVRNADKSGKGWASIDDIEQARRKNTAASSAPIQRPEPIATKAGRGGL